MNISSFDDLLRAAREQSEPQRLLFVFANAVLPDDSTPEQRARFEAGQGGALAPLMSVDKTPEALGTLAELVEESRQFGHDWAIVFAASLSGRGGRAPTSNRRRGVRDAGVAARRQALARAGRTGGILRTHGKRLRPAGTFRVIRRLHWLLLAVSLITVAGAAAGSHGWRLGA